MASKCCHKSLDSFPDFYQPASPERIELVARKELGESTTLKEDCLQKLKTLIKDNKVVSISRDDYLLRFLRYKKFRVEESFEALRNYASFRASIHERLLKLTPEVVKASLDHKVMGFLPYRDDGEKQTFFCRPGIWNTGICSIEDVQMVDVLLSNYTSENESSQVLGMNIILDWRNLPFSYLIQMLPYLNFWKMFLLKSLPVRIHDLHLIADSKLIKVAYPLVAPFTPKKIRDKILFHATTEELCQHICPSTLPNEFGGTLGLINNGRTTEAMIEYLQNMKSEQQHFLK